MLEEVKDEVSQTVFRRCQYIIQENKRVLVAAEFLKNNELNEFGDLLYQCHDGIRHKYEVSCEELDFLVDFSKEKEYVIGSRMMGGGFGGCTVNIVHKDYIDAYTEEVSIAYKERFNIDLDAFQVMPSKGTSIEFTKSKVS